MAWIHMNGVVTWLRKEHTREVIARRRRKQGHKVYLAELGRKIGQKLGGARPSSGA